MTHGNIRRCMVDSLRDLRNIMAADKGKTKNPQVSPSWGILLGLGFLPVLALMAKLYPGQTLVWEGIGAVCIAWAGHSFYRYMTADPRRAKHGNDALQH
jgi:hypothetical protein